MARPLVVCLTPVRNEEWILERFLRCASLWADRILVADQGSTDRSREIARSFPKVRLLENPRPGYDEASRQQLLLAAARELPGPRFLVALDADEVLSAGCLGGGEWERILAAPPGTGVVFDYAQLGPRLGYCWLTPGAPLGFHDDGRPHAGRAIHSPRLPDPGAGGLVRAAGMRVLHYQYADWDRMESKHRWYQCWERLHHPRRRAVRVYRQYHHMDAVPGAARRPVDPSWLEGYERRGIDMRSVAPERASWWDREVLAWLAEHGPAAFRREAIWDVDWGAIAAALGVGADLVPADPRRPWERLMHRWLRRSQPFHRRWAVRQLDRAAKVIGW